MSEIALYEVLKRIPEVSNDEARAAVADVASRDEVATKSDIADINLKIAELKTEIANLEARLTNRMYGMAGVIIAAVGIIKYL